MTASDDQSSSEPQSGTAASVTASGRRSIAAQAITGTAMTGDHARAVTLAPGVLQHPDGIQIPAAGLVGLPRPASPVFVGREGVLVELDQFLAARRCDGPGGIGVIGQARTIHGLGGVGKSEVALQYAHRRRGPGALVWWVAAETPTQIAASLADLTFHLHPEAATVFTTDEAATWADTWLQAHQGWLLILDNVEDPAHITPILAGLTCGDIVITTRRDIDWRHHGATPLYLDTLDRDA